MLEPKEAMDPADFRNLVHGTAGKCGADEQAAATCCRYFQGATPQAGIAVEATATWQPRSVGRGPSSGQRK
jgi:hypothetical protein